MALALFLLGASLPPRGAAALDVPPLTAYVVDGAGLLPAARRKALEARLVEHAQRTGQQLAVLTLPSQEEEDLSAYAVRVFEAWKLGHKGHDDGMLLAIAQREHRAHIEVGYGLEGNIPDARARRIIADVLAPAFRREAYAEGIEQAVAALLELAAGEPLDGEATQRPMLPPLLTLLLLGVALFILVNFTPPGTGPGGGLRRGGRRGGLFGGGLGGGWSSGGGGSGPPQGGGGRSGGGGASGGW